jgi:hypothetical protein
MKKKIISFTLVCTGFLLGASALVAVAQTSGWSAPHLTPPNCITDPNDPNYDAGCVAPINVGSSAQTKNGPLTLNYDDIQQIGLQVLGQVQIVDGNQGPGKILMSDANGIASWQTPVATSLSECVGEGLTYEIPNGAMDDTGSSGSNDNMEIYCRNGIARFCLSKEACPWRTDITSDDSHVCLRDGFLNTTKVDPDNTKLLLMVSSNSSGSYGWKGFSKYYCGVDGTVKDMYYVAANGAHIRGGSPIPPTVVYSCSSPYTLDTVNEDCVTTATYPSPIAISFSRNKCNSPYTYNATNNNCVTTTSLPSPKAAYTKVSCPTNRILSGNICY